MVANRTQSSSVFNMTHIFNICCMCQMFLSAHYAGEDIVLKLQPNEPWKKIFGPTFVYLNTLLDGHEDPLELWEDAKYQV
jgi:rhamnogalacturonan endolyase